MAADQEMPLSELARDLPLQDIFDEIAGEGATEVPTSAFIESIIARMRCTFEYARDLVYRLLELGRAVLTSEYHLRLAA